MTKRKPFFSIVIPCYNNGSYAPGQYIDRVLNSICNQGLKKWETEVIVADDHSKFPYTDTLDSYKDRLNIKYVETEYNCCPGNTRQRGVEEAEGKWICFIDHDDAFTEGALSEVKNFINETKEDYVVCTLFNKVSFQNPSEVVESFDFQKGFAFVHGKFFNKENFWDSYQLHFMKDLKTCEDIALSKQIQCILFKLDRNPSMLNKVTYLWTDNPSSISNVQYYPAGYRPQEFFKSHFNDYLVSHINSVLEFYQNGLTSKNIAISMIFSSLTGAWSILSDFESKNLSDYSQKNDAYCSRAWAQIKSIFNIDLTVTKVILQRSFADLLRQTADIAKRQHIPFSFIDWLSYIDKVNFLSILYTAKESKPENNTHRPYFSLVVACYNDGRYKEGVYLDRLLSSVAKQDILKEDLEVILADDCSPVPFFENLENKYKDKLHLKYIKTDYNFAPGNTRAKGVSIATGEWLCFADHDDIFYEGAFKQVQESITARNEQHFAFGDFYGVDTDGNVTRKYEKTLSWCHGKFYNKDNFWDKYGIHFVHDLKSHEDIAICTQVSCALASNISSYTYIHKPLYAWTDNPQSVSHAKYTVDTEDGPREFLEVFYSDYITSTGYTYLDQFKEHRIKITFAIKGVLEIMCYAYFYQQGFMFRRPDDYYKKNLEIAGKFIYDCKKTFNLTNDSIYKAISSNNAAMYYEVLDQAKMACGHYIPTHGFREWLDIVCKD